VIRQLYIPEERDKMLIGEERERGQGKASNE
jgi:hypothetical protein